MRLLVLDTADPRGSLTVFQPEGGVFSEAHPSEEDYSSWLLPAARRVLAAAGLTLSGLDAYGVCAGPGSFTGLRVGLTTVKAWAEIHSKPIVAVSRLEALAENLPGEQAPEPFVAAFLDARRKQVFAALFETAADRRLATGPEAVLPLEEFVREALRRSGDRPVCWRTPDAALLEAIPDWPRLVRKGHRLDPLPVPLGARLALLAERKLLAGETTDAIALDANYVRRSDAELFWKESSSPEGTGGHAGGNRS
jgi:tRNA threonylcarbamoyladenosine biosynthesis protein TsaB